MKNLKIQNIIERIVSNENDSKLSL